MTGLHGNSSGATPELAPRQRIEIVVDLAWIAIATVALVVASRLQFATAFGPGPGLMPTALAAILLGLGLLRFAPVAIDGLRRGSFRLAAIAEPDASPANVLRFVALFGAIVLYATLLEVFGFTLMSGALALATLLIFGVRPLPALAFAVISAVALRIGFGTLLSVQLPSSGLPLLAGLGL